MGRLPGRAHGQTVLEITINFRRLGWLSTSGRLCFGVLVLIGTLPTVRCASSAAYRESSGEYSAKMRLTDRRASYTES